MNSVMTFKQYTTKVVGTATLTVFDIDETLFHTTAQIRVIKDGSVVKTLSNQEFNTYSLNPGESFDFKEFSDADKFYKESKPIAAMLHKAKAILSSIKLNPDNRVIIVTARADFDNKERFLDTFRKHGFDIDRVRVERAGNIRDIQNSAVKKYVIIRNYLLTKQYTRVRLFDDCMENLNVFLRLRREFPGVIFEAYFARPDGRVQRV
jgi:hypothetical protein